MVAITFHPLRANSKAVARPRPVELPVMKMVLLMIVRSRGRQDVVGAR